MTNKYKSIIASAVPASDYYRSNGNKPDSSLLKSKERSTRHLVPKEEQTTKPEKRIQAEIIAFLKSKNFWVHKIKAVNLVGSFSAGTAALVPTEDGLPDILSISPSGIVLAIEVKGASGRATIKGSQLRQLQRLRDHKAHAIVAHSVARVERYLQESHNLTRDVHIEELPTLKPPQQRNAK